MDKTLLLILYYGIGRWLPSSASFCGGISKRIRAVLVSRLFKSCGTGVNIERGASFGSGAQVSLGDRSGIGINSRVIGPAVIGDDVMMGPNVTILTTSHRTDDVARPMNTQGALPERSVTIEDDVWIGMNVLILPGVRIGRGAIIGAGAVVPKDIPAYAVAVGNPARVVRNRRDEGGRT